VGWSCAIELSPDLMASFVRTGRKIVAIGRNYAKHAKELGNAVPEKPFFFLKPTTSYVFNGGNVEIPQGVLVHHEGTGNQHIFLHLRITSLVVELGVIIGKTGRDIAAVNADEHVAGYGEQVPEKYMFSVNGYTFIALGIDMTGRNVQDAAKKKGLPWSTAKGFDTFTPIR
jgi:acylpyruvate hydrolase